MLKMMTTMTTTTTTRQETKMNSPPVSLTSSPEVEVGQKYSQEEEEVEVGTNKKLMKNYYYGTSPSQAVIYRNVKYSGTWGRYSIYVHTYVKLWLTPLVTGPFVSWFSQCHEYLLQILGFFYLLLFTPLHLFIGLVLLLIRQIRLYLVRKYYPKALVALDLDLSPRNVFSSGKNLEMVTTIIMLKGKLDVQKLRSYFSRKSLNSCILLRKKMTKLMGIRVFLDSTNFDIKSHIVEAPVEFLKYFVMDEKIVGKSALQRFVTSVASENLTVDMAPWKITVIKIPVFNKEKTCCVLRFHYVLLNDPEVSQMVDNIFNQSVYHDVGDDYYQQHQQSKVCLDFPRMTQDSNQIKFLDDDDDADVESTMVNLKEKLTFRENSENSTLVLTENDKGGGRFQRHFDEPTIILFKCFMKMSYNLQRWIYSNLYVSRSDMKTWINLQKKQFQFHGRSAIVKSILYELFLFLKKLVITAKSVPQSSHCTELKHMMELLTMILRAICYVPIEIFSSIIFFHHDPTRGVGGLLRRRRAVDRKTEVRRISWSAPISRDLLKHIQRQTGASTQSILLAAIGDSLKDYFSETGLRNPKSLGVMLPVSDGNLLASTGYRTLTLSTEQTCVPEQLKKVDSQLKSFASWKILGNYYIMRYVTYILPRPLTNLLLQKIFKRYPISFTKLDLQPPSSFHLLPHMSLWGQTVEEFCFWRPPESDYSVSVVLVNYAEVLRISVLSPMNSLDTALTQRFSQNLNRIAEQSGVDRHLIPYSRKSSPLSSTCSSPFVLRNDEK